MKSELTDGQVGRGGIKPVCFECVQHWAANHSSRMVSERNPLPVVTSVLRLIERISKLYGIELRLWFLTEHSSAATRSRAVNDTQMAAGSTRERVATDDPERMIPAREPRFSKATPMIKGNFMWSFAQRWHCFALIVLVFSMIAIGFHGRTGMAQQGDASKQAEDTSKQVDAASVREQTIYIPYSKLREVFEKEGRGVFLPYDKFQELWRAAREKPTTPTPTRSLIGAVITEIANEATVERDVVKVHAKLSISLLKSGWHQIPLRLNDAAIQSAKIGDEPARLIFDPTNGYVLMVENREPGENQIELQLEYARAFTKSPGQNSVVFNAPQAPVNRWRIRIPESGAKISVQPMLAATEEPSSGEARDPANPQANTNAETVVLAFVGAAPQVRIDWTPKAEGATGLTALAEVQTLQEVIVEDNVLRIRAQLRYDISRAELKELTVEVPADLKVINVFNPNVRKWEVMAQENIQTIKVQLFEPARASQNLNFELEKYFDPDDRAPISVAAIRAVEAGRQQGTLVIRVSPSMRVEATDRSGLTQVDANELPNEWKNQEWNYAYRFAAVPFHLNLALEKIEPRVSVEQLVEVYLEPQQWTVDLTAIYNIEQAGIFQLEFDIPPGFDIRQVIGHAISGVPGAQIDRYYLEGDAKDHLVVNLRRKALGKVGIWIELQKRIEDANLNAPTGSASSLNFSVPRANQRDLERATGKLVLYAPESLRIIPGADLAARGVAMSEAFANLASVRQGRFPLARDMFAISLTDQATALELSVERRKPQITARQMVICRIESGILRYDARIFYDIRYSGVKSLRLDVPTSMASTLRNTSTTIRERAIDPAPDDVKEGYVAWNLTGDSELFGEQVVPLHWEQKLEELGVGKSLDLQIPMLMPMNVDRSWGQLAIAKSELLDVRTKEAEGLRPIDPQHDLVDRTGVSDVARAFEFHDPWTLNVTVTRYQLEEIKRTSIERAYVRMVVTRSSQIGVQAMYRLRSAQQRLPIRLPAKAEFDSQPLKINGNPATLERGVQDELFIPIVGHDPGEPIFLELRYTVPGSASQLDLPVFADDPAVQKVYVGVYLPTETKLIGIRGPWTEEWTWQSGSDEGVRAVPHRGDAELTEWVKQGIAINGSTTAFGETNGYLFSALRPQPPPDGSLRLVTASRNFLNGGILCLLALVGLGFLARPAREKVIVIGAVILVALLIGAFAPTFARQLFGLPIVLGLWLIGILWCLWYIVRVWPRAWHQWRSRAKNDFRPLKPMPNDAVPATAAVGATSGAASPDGPSSTGGDQPHDPTSGGPHHG